MSKVLSVREASEYLNISKNTLYKLIQEGEIPARKFGRQWRISQAILDKFFEETTQ